MNTEVIGKQGKRDLSVIDIEKTLDRLEYLEHRFALQDDLENDYYSLLEKAEYTIKAMEKLHENSRWNIDIDGNDLLICKGYHERAEPCEYERYVLGGG